MARTTEAACTQTIDDFYTVDQSWDDHVGIVIRGTPVLMSDHDANTDYDWWTGRKIPEKTRKGSKVYKERDEAFLIPAKCELLRVFVGGNYRAQGADLERRGWRNIHYNLEEFDLNDTLRTQRILSEHDIPWTEKPFHDGEELTRFYLIRPLNPGLGFARRMFVTPEIARWVVDNHGVFLGGKTLWDKSSALMAAFPAPPAPWPANTKGFEGVVATPRQSLPKATFRDPPAAYWKRPKGRKFDQCQPANLKIRIIRDVRTPFAFVEHQGHTKVWTTDEGFAALVRLLNEPLCGKQESRRGKRKAASKTPFSRHSLSH